MSNNSLGFEEHSISPSQTSSPQSLPRQMKSIYWLNGIVSYPKYFLNATEKKPCLGSRVPVYHMGWLLFYHCDKIRQRISFQEEAFIWAHGSWLQRLWYMAFAFTDSWFTVRQSIKRVGMCGGALCLTTKKSMAQNLLN